MGVRCPKCHQALDLEAGHCASDHRFTWENGVLVLLPDALRRQLDAIYQHRQGVTLPPIPDYNRLPWSLKKQHFEWRMRCHDAEVVQRLIDGGPPARQILEIGAWNGWLTHRLARAGHQVTAVDYTSHPTDGLGAIVHYDTDWLAIQMDLTDLSIFEPDYDLVIVNHGLHLFSDPAAYIRQARRLLKPGGQLVLLSLTFYRDPGQRRQQLAQLTRTFEQQYGVPFLLKPSRGYMDSDDKTALAALGIRLRRYPQRWQANLKALLNPAAPAYYYGVG